MNKILAVGICFCFISSVVWADMFGTGENQFAIEFVNISGDAGDLGSWSAEDGYVFSGVNHGNYRMGKFEVTNDQWTKFKGNIAPMQITGDPSSAYDQNPYFTGTNVPINNVSWYEAAQFVNWLNTSTNHAAAYKFTGTRGTSDYTFGVWSESDDGYNAANPYRNSNAFYFLPTENEWVKAAYWNGSALQTYATKAGELYRGNGSNGGWNYNDDGHHDPWAVGSGSEELNGTFDMMGNMWEWMESPRNTGDYMSGSIRDIRGGLYANGDGCLASYARFCNYPYYEDYIGFRVATVPEPASVVLILAGLSFLRKRRG